MAHDVLHLDDGVVHQDADHQRHGQQRHHVDGETHVMHADEGRNGRQRQRHGRDHGGAEVAQEQPDHQHRKDGALVQQQHGAVELLFHRRHEIERLGDLQVGAAGLQFLELGAYAMAHLDLAGATAARHLEAHHRLAVEEGRGRGFGDSVLHLGDLVQADAAPVRERELQTRQLFGRGQHGERAQRLLAAAHVGAAAGAFDLHLGELARNVGRRGAQRLQLERVEQDLHLAVDPAHPIDRAHAAHRQQQLGDVVFHEPGDGLVVHLVGADGVGQHRAAGEFELVDDGFAQVGGQIAPDLGHGRAHVVQRFLRGLFQAELGRDGGATVLHLGVDVLQSLHGGDRVLDLARHFGFQLRGCCTRQRHRYGDGRQVDVREILHLHGVEGQHARERQQDEQHDGRYGISDRPGGDIDHELLSLFCSRSRRCC